MTGKPTGCRTGRATTGTGSGPPDPAGVAAGAAWTGLSGGGRPPRPAGGRALLALLPVLSSLAASCGGAGDDGAGDDGGDVEGALTDVFGGVDGFAVGRDAPPEAVEFLRYISRPEQAIRIARTGSTLPVTEGSEEGIEDPLQQEVASAPAGSSFVQIYLDQAFSSESGATINDAVQSLFAGQAGAGDIAETITSQAQSG